MALSDAHGTVDSDDWIGLCLQPERSGPRHGEDLHDPVQDPYHPRPGRSEPAGLERGRCDKWLATKSKTLSTWTLQGLHGRLNRAIKRALARDKVERNVVALCSVPKGKEGRPSETVSYVVSRMNRL